MMMPMDAAWSILKGTRQTTLGEFHPDLPSPHGPITAFRRIPTNELMPNALKRVGLKPRTSEYNANWENMIGEDTQLEPFDVSKPGIWVHPPSKNVSSWRSGVDETTVGIRGKLPPGQFRNAGFRDEPAEGYLSEPITPEQLVHNINEDDLPDTEPIWMEKAWSILKSRLDNLMTPSKPSLFGGDE